MSRLATIADTAIAIVADQGMRGLTHRAVDARAGLPPGSTSAYHRTRKALIEALVHRLAELDRADQAQYQLAGERLTATGLDQLADGIAGLLDHWLTAGRDRTLVRYACLLEATHHPELRTILDHGTHARVQARAILAAAGATDPDRAGDHFVAFVDGLLFDRLAGAGARSAPAAGTPEHRADLANAVRGALRGLAV